MSENIKIAGNYTISDWKKLSNELSKNLENVDLWEKAFDFFKKRLETRYLNPIRYIEENGNSVGEGFAVVTIICSTIEALESFYQGKSYRKGSTEHPLDQNTEYFKSQPIFESFLQNREPFKSYFSDKGLATNFYENVRCGILHEAATRGGWKIKTCSSKLIERHDNYWILNRKLLVQAIEDYLKSYKTELFSSQDLKKAFIRKFDAICESA
ncbi:hypothetical protein [Methylophilus sp. DW102]|uniref:hypothetical protein n=1 Tax=Methylophilus sp. DW102 TaxID=3095607 RepID=UPI0030901871|nr:hypothetical protein MTDW_07990 [Methylophilus sp. DW102]